MDLKDIGFYTLSDERVKQTSVSSPLQRCEVLITDACNFACNYCREWLPEYQGTLSFDDTVKTLDYWVSQGLVNVRFSGGEPTLHKQLPRMVEFMRCGGCKRIAVSTNGSAPQAKYDELLAAGVNDFSVSLDACCSSTGDTMAGVKGAWEKVIYNIGYLAKHSYTTVGIVLTDTNVAEAVKTIELAHDLGVSDIRVIPAAQTVGLLSKLDVKPELLEAHPILKYRVQGINSGDSVRGLCASDYNRCPLVLDDMAVVRDYHFPCIIYLREHGMPIGRIGEDTRQQRYEWFKHHDTYRDPICQKQCLSFCRDYNNKYREFHGDAT